MKAALNEVKRRKAGGESFLPVLVIPEGDDDGYLAHKADFSHAGIPSQVCTLKVIQDEYALKWAIANIALQVFCKAGGQPWKVRPSSEPTLIIGISQSHKLKEVNRTRTVEEYFAFSVLTDNSGLFRSIQVLGDSGNQPEYLKQLRASLKAALVRNAAVHSRRRPHLIQAEAGRNRRDPGDCQPVRPRPGRRGFAVRSGEGESQVPLLRCQRARQLPRPLRGHDDASRPPRIPRLVRGDIPRQADRDEGIPRAKHLEFLRVSDGAGIGDADLLQDIVNLSGANWRGLNAKTARLGLLLPPGRRPGPRLPRAWAAAAAGPAHPALVSLI